MKKSTYIMAAISVGLTVCQYVGAQSLNDIVKVSGNDVKGKFETADNGDTQLNYYNSDYCDYYMFRLNDRAYILRPGRTTIFTQRQGSNVQNPFNSPGRYYSYKGSFPKKFNAEFPYILPVAEGKQVCWRTDRRERMKTMNFDIVPGDTVYAVRYGTACIVKDPRQLLVYHSDKTFAAYMMMSECFVMPGETVFPGMPVGRAGLSGVSISFFFLDRNKFSDSEAVSYPYTHFIPCFSTVSGVVRPHESIDVTAWNPDKLVTMEMSRREKKKYLRNRKPGPEIQMQEAPRKEALTEIHWMHDPVDSQVKEAAEKRISAEMAYLKRLGLEPDLDFTIHCFTDRDSAAVFLENEFGRSVNTSRYRTFYMSKEKTGLLVGYDGTDPDRNVINLTDLLSRHIVRSAAKNVPAPTWFSSGITRYFVSWHTGRDGSSYHVLDPRDIVKVKSAALTRGSDIRPFLEISHNDYNKMQSTDDGLAYALSHIIITIIIDKGYDDTARAMMTRERGEKPADIIERTYPGGIDALEKDILEKVGIELEE